MARAMTNTAIITAWAPATSGVSTASTASLSLAIEAASVAIEAITGMMFLQADYVATHSGARATGRLRDTLWLEDPVTGNATPQVSSVGTLTENLTAVTTVAFPGALSGSDVALYDKRSGALTRVSVSNGIAAPKAWAYGYANIQASYTAGWTFSAIPGDIQFVCNELAWAIYREAFRVGIDSVSQAGSSVSLRSRLSGYANTVLDTYTLANRQRTAAI